MHIVVYIHNKIYSTHISVQHDSADSIQEVLVSLIDNVESATRKVVDQRKKASNLCIPYITPKTVF